jgi:hypothetical protein
MLHQNLYYLISMQGMIATFHYILENNALKMFKIFIIFSLLQCRNSFYFFSLRSPNVETGSVHSMFLVLLYVCSHTAGCVLILLVYVLILLHMCSHTAVSVCSYYYICVLILLYVSSYCYVFSYCCICVLILLHMCPHTAIYVSSYCYICVLISQYI